MDIASRIGEENLHRWEALLDLAKAAADRDTPRPETAYGLSRAAELTYHYVERDKHFDWRGTVEALTELCASSVITILSRWRDRRFGDAGRLLPVAIEGVVAQGRLPSMTPIALAGLSAEWDRLAAFRLAASAASDSAQRTVYAQVGYRYTRLEEHDKETWSNLVDLQGAYGLNLPDVDRLLSHAVRSATERAVTDVPTAGTPGDPRGLDWTEIFRGIDVTNSASLHSAYRAMRTSDLPWKTLEFYREAWNRVQPGRASEFVHAIADWPDFGMSVLRELVDALPSRLPNQVSLRRALHDATLSACRREPESVRWNRWGALLPFDRLHAEGVVTQKEVIGATVEGFAAHIERMPAWQLFQLLAPLSTQLSREEADQTLTFGFDLLGEVLRNEDGDGPWRAELEPPQSATTALAGYVWAGLGSPVVAERWECAHVVRSIVELGWTDLLDALIGFEASSAADPFVDRGLEFHLWHARQWLLIGLARGALENPVALGRAAALLETCLRDDHVLLRELAARTIRALTAAGQVEGIQDVDLGRVNRPSLTEDVYCGWPSEPPDDESGSTGIPESDDEKYYFGIDVGPHWLRPLGRAFGLREHAIERLAFDAVRRRLSGTQGTIVRDDARRTRRIFSEGETHHSHGSLPSTDDLRAYHAYHAMMLVAGELLRTRRVRRREGESQDEFQEWLEGYLPARADGRWLADRRDPQLIVAPPAPRGYGDRVWRWSVGADYLDKQLESDGEMMVLWGRWTTGGDGYSETVSVRSALAVRTAAEALVAALQSGPELGRFWLPSALADEDDDLQLGRLELRGWVVDKTVPAGLDEGDPWATGLRYPGLAPSEEMRAALRLLASEDERFWGNSFGAVLRSETWTHLQRDGRDSETIAGSRLSANNAFLTHLLNSYSDYSLVVSVEVQRRTRYEKETFEIRPQPYARYYLIGGDHVAHAIASSP